MAMLIEYDKTPNISVDRKVQTLAESVQRALDNIEVDVAGKLENMPATKGQDGKDAILLQIESSTGNIFKNTDVNTTLHVTIIVGDKVITTAEGMRQQFGNESKLLWGYKPMGQMEFTQILEGDDRIGSEGFTLAINPADVAIKSTFSCSLSF